MVLPSRRDNHSPGFSSFSRDTPVWGRTLTPFRFCDTMLSMNSLDREVIIARSIADISEEVKRSEKSLQDQRYDLQETIRGAYAEGMSVTEIADNAGISRQRIYRYLTQVPLPDRF